MTLESLQSDGRTELDGLRIRLEGKLEVLEGALSRHHQLQQWLSGRNWLQKVREHRGELGELASKQASIAHAVDAVGQLKRREGWPEDSEGARVLARVEASQQRTVARLSELFLGLELSGLLAALISKADAVRLAGPDENTVLQGEVASSSIFWWFPAWGLSLYVLAFSVMAYGLWGLLSVPGIALVFSALSRWMRRSQGHFWLGHDRVIWSPRGAEPQQFGLEVTPGLPFLKGDPATRASLTTLLHLFRTGPLKGIDRPRGGDTLVFKGSQELDGPDRQGTLLLNRRGVCFVPDDQAGALMRALTGVEPQPCESVEFILNELTRLPGPVLEEALEKVKAVPGAVIGWGDEVRGERSATPSRLMRVKVAGVTLDATLNPERMDALMLRAPWTLPRGD